MKILKYIEYTLAVLTILFGLLCCFSIPMAVPYAAEIFIVIMGTYIMFYMIAGTVLYKPDDSEKFKNKFSKTVFSFLCGMNLSICLAGIFFKLMRWPGADSMLVFGLIGILLFLVLNLIYWISTKSIYSKSLLKTYIIFLIITSVLYFSSNDTLTELKYRNYPDECVELLKEAEREQNSAKFDEARDCMRDSRLE